MLLILVITIVVLQGLNLWVIWQLKSELLEIYSEKLTAISGVTTRLGDIKHYDP